MDHDRGYEELRDGGEEKQQSGRERHCREFGPDPCSKLYINQAASGRGT
jgi:hypothetical protein